MIVWVGLLLAAAPPACDVTTAEKQRQVGLSYDAFDSVPAPHGWRALNTAGCTDAAVALLESYLATNGSRLTAEQKREMPFHIGQTYAFGGRNADAAPWFEQADSPDAPDEWRAYAAAHVAFFRHDRPALERARARYAAAAKPGSVRLKLIDGLLACIGKGYMEAAHCAM